jgi:hypothetical protein
LKKILTLAIISLLLLSTFSIHAPQVKAEILPGSSEKGILKTQWSYGLAPRYWWGYFGSSAAIADLGPDVNNKGTDPDSDLEIVVGCDGYHFYSAELGYVYGLWRCLDSQGNWEWATDTKSDEARSSPALVDLNGDGHLEIAAGTTSGETFEVMDRLGKFVWTFPSPPRPGNFYYPGSPAVADLNPNLGGLEIVIGNRPFGTVLCFDGDNSDGVDEGISAVGIPGSPYAGVEGLDWDLLWIFYGGEEIWASPAIGDINNDGTLEVIIGSTNGKLFILNGLDGVLETSIDIGSAIYASSALANLDADPYLEIVVGTIDGKVYCFQWDGKNHRPEWNYSTGGAIYSSASIGDVDGDGKEEIVVSSCDGNVYCISSTGKRKWSYHTNGEIYSSPTLFDVIRVNKYDQEWPMFRHDPQRTGYYGKRPRNELDVGLYILVGSNDGFLHLICGKSGAEIDRFSANGQIHTSPSVADLDGDNKLEAVFYDWSSTDTLWVVEIDRILGQSASELAIDLIGIPYSWGGKGWDVDKRKFVSIEEMKEGYHQPSLGGIFHKGVDCAGLVFWAYNRGYFGDRILPKDTSESMDRPLSWTGVREQRLFNTYKLVEMEKIRKGELTLEELKTLLKLGDLLFMTRHVMMYVGDFIYEGKIYDVVHAEGIEFKKVVPARLILQKIGPYYTLQVVTEFEGKIGRPLTVEYIGRVKEAQIRSRELT